MIRLITKILIAALLVAVFPQNATANDLAVWDKLRGSSPKGYVLLLRHSLAPGVGDPANFNLRDCTTQRNLSQEGREDAVDLGIWIKRLDIDIYRVESSRWCRAKETAQLLNLGKVRLNKNLDSLFQEVDPINHPQTAKITKQIKEHRNKRGLLILVGHYVNIAAIADIGVDSGEGVLVRASKKGLIQIIGATPDLGR